MTTPLDIRLEESNDSDFPRLVVNGITDEQSSVFESTKGLLHASIYDDRVWNALTAVRLGQLACHFSSITTPWELGGEGSDNVEISLSSLAPEHERHIQFELQPDAERWARPYSLAEYAEALEDAVKKLGTGEVAYYADDLLLNGFGIRCRICTGDPLVIDELNRCAGILERLREEAEKRLSVSARQNTVTTFFKFPPEIKTACGQYLLYFVQFLQDLGIEAEAEIKENASRLLFSVTPADGPRALENVRQALQIYLQLPATAGFETAAAQYPDLAVHQLHANVLHLQSQLMLAKASLQCQQATIEALQVSNYQYKQLISSQSEAKEQTEPLIGDLVHVTKIEGKGMSLNLPLLFRKLKRVLRRPAQSPSTPRKLIE